MHRGAQAGGGRIANQGDNGYPEEVRGLGMSLFPGVFSSGGPPGPAGIAALWIPVSHCVSNCARRPGEIGDSTQGWEPVGPQAPGGTESAQRVHDNLAEGRGCRGPSNRRRAKRARWMLRRTRIAGFCREVTAKRGAAHRGTQGMGE